MSKKTVHCFEKKKKKELFAMLKVSKAGYLEQRLKMYLVIKYFLWQIASKM